MCALGLVAFLAVQNGAWATVLVGAARVLDGDTLVIGETHVRLEGMVAAHVAYAKIQMGTPTGFLLPLLRHHGPDWGMSRLGERHTQGLGMMVGSMGTDLPLSRIEIHITG